MSSSKITIVIVISLLSIAINGQQRSFSSYSSSNPGQSYMSSSNNGGNSYHSSSSSNGGGVVYSSSSNNGGPATVYVAVLDGNILNYSNGGSVSTYSDGQSITVNSDRFGSITVNDVRGPYVVDVGPDGRLQRREMTQSDRDQIVRREAESRAASERMSRNFQQNWNSFGGMKPLAPLQPMAPMKPLQPMTQMQPLQPIGGQMQSMQMGKK